MMATAPILIASKVSTPDCLSGLLFFVGMSFMLERRRLLPAVLFLLLSLFARIDNIIVCFLLVSLLAFEGRWMKISRAQYLLALAAMAACYLLISYSGMKYGWSIFYYPSMMHHMDTDTGITGHFSFRDYAWLTILQLKSGLYFEQIVVYMMMLLFIFINKTKQQRPTFDQMVA